MRNRAAFVALAVAACVFASQSFAVDRPSKPNIVIFLSDDMGWGQLGYQGGKDIPTPNIDRIAAEGTRLTQFYVCSVCSPSRASLMTGRYPFHNGMEERTHGADTGGMLPDERTLAQALRDAGYYTAILGKWHLGSWYSRHLPMQRGFDHQYGYYGALIDTFTKMREGVYDWHRDQQPINEPGYTTFLIADEFARTLDRLDPAKPFFFYVAFNAVHGPHDAPPEYLKKYESVKGGRAKEYPMLECMDVAIGRMLDSLKQKGLLDNTLVIFFNDNGAPAGIGNAPYRGHKGENYEGGVRVACALRWPGHVKSGATVDEMLHAVDLYPTLVKLAGGSPAQPLPLDGRDAWPTITDDQPTPHKEIVLSVPGFDRSETGPASIRVGDLKLVGDELYDIRNDPYEKQNIAAQRPDEVRQMKSRLRQLAAERRPPEPHGRIPVSPLLLLGEDENKKPLPEWLTKLAAEHRDAAPKGKKGKKRAKVNPDE